MFGHRRNPRYASASYRRSITWTNLITVFAALAVVVSSAGLVSQVARAQSTDLGAIEDEFDRAVRIADDLRTERLATLRTNRDEEVAALDAENAVAEDAIDAERDAAMAALEERHADRLIEIAAAYTAAIGAADDDHSARLDRFETLYDAMVAELDPNGDADHDLKKAAERAKDSLDDAAKAELAALKADYEAASEAVEGTLDDAETAWKADLDALKAAYEADKDAIEDAERAALDILKARYDALIAPHEAEKKFWEAEKKAIESVIDDQYKPTITALKDKGKDEEAAKLDDIRKQERLDNTVVERAMIEELKGIIDDLKDAHRAEEAPIKDAVDVRLTDLKITYEADRDVRTARYDERSAGLEGQLDTLETEYRTAKTAIEDGYDKLEDELKEQQTLFSTTADEQRASIEDIRYAAHRAAKSTRDADIDEEHDVYRATKSAIEARHHADRDTEDDTHAASVRDAVRRYDAAVAQVERNHQRTVDLLASDYYLTRERVEAFLATDRLISVDEFYDAKSDPGSLYNVTKRIDAHQPEYTGAGVQVVLIDTGIVDVPGLRHSNVTIGPDFSFEDGNKDLRARDTNGHGTHLAGIIVASDAGFVAGDTERRPERVLGVAPAAELISIKVGAADGAVDVTQVIAAVDWVIRSNEAGSTDIRVINLAFGTDSDQDPAIDPLSYAVERAWESGIVVVVAAGNDGLDATRLTNPATNPYVIAVGAGQAKSDGALVVSGFSSESKERMVDILAPGRSIASLRNPGSHADMQSDTHLENAQLVRGSGTSQAAAVISGVVALMLEHRPELTPDQVKYLLMDTAVDAKGSTYAAGFVDAHDAVRESLPSDPATFVQTHSPATGTGSIDEARGNVRIEIDGIVLEGEVDIFGNDWSGNSWTGNSWTGNSWTGNSWTGNSWTGNSWTGNSWTGNSWTGNSWTGNSWTGNSWTGNSWTGNSWTGNSWTGNSWTGNSWTSVVWGS